MCSMQSTTAKNRYRGKLKPQQPIMNPKVYIDIGEHQLPIVYHSKYNVSLLGLENLHPFDAHKWGRIFNFLKEGGLLTDETVTTPKQATKEDLLTVHSKKYLRGLKCPCKVASIAELPALVFVPNFIIQKAYLSPMRYQVGGSILAGKLALERGWAINLGGGFHHCSGTRGGGFCPYADITILIEYLFRYNDDVVRNVMIIDLDAHQGNGYERDFRTNHNVYIFDMYNNAIYPWDVEAKSAIRKCVELASFIEDESYLYKLEINLNTALNEFEPDIVVYNAGTDILVGDPLGQMSITAEGIIKRDEIVFRKVVQTHTPIVMLTSGGYLKSTAQIIANSIMNLKKEGLISGPGFNNGTRVANSASAGSPCKT